MKMNHLIDLGMEEAENFDENEALEMLRGHSIYDMYRALGIIRKRNFLSALSTLESMALYDEDMSIQVEAYMTVRALKGKGTRTVLQKLKENGLHKLMMDNWFE